MGQPLIQSLASEAATQAHGAACGRCWQSAGQSRLLVGLRGDLGAGVIFVVGMPRSGTSLIEHILAAHPSVHAGGELSMLGELVHAMISSAERSPDEAMLIGQRYMAGLPALERLAAAMNCA